MVITDAQAVSISLVFIQAFKHIAFGKATARRYQINNGALISGDKKPVPYSKPTTNIPEYLEN